MLRSPSDIILYRDLGLFSWQSAHWKIISYACEIINQIFVVHFYVKLFWIEHQNLLDELEWQWKSMGQLFKSKTHTYFTGGGILPILSWNKIDQTLSFYHWWGQSNHQFNPFINYNTCQIIKLCNQSVLSLFYRLFSSANVYNGCVCLETLKICAH